MKTPQEADKESPITSKPLTCKEALQAINDVINQQNYTDSLPARYSKIKAIASKALAKEDEGKDTLKIEKQEDGSHVAKMNLTIKEDTGKEGDQLK